MFSSGLIFLVISLPLVFGRVPRNLNELDNGHHHGLDADDPDFSGIVDFSNAVPGPGGSWCITKTKYIDHMVKDQIKECWHQNVTQCHDTYVTEFLPSQEQKCEESFWKSCKIDFREMPYNYTMKQCHTPLVKKCDSGPKYGKPEIVCKTWFESECNTTYIETTPNVEDKPNTWCKKVPRKICAPDNCKMESGPEQCNEKVLVSTVQKPTEICDLQPQQHCRLITKLTPHLLSKEVCKNIPKEVCHLALSGPKTVRKPMTLKWCTKNRDGTGATPAPTYTKPSYLPPPPPPGSRKTITRKNNNNFTPPTYASPTSRPIPNFQTRPDDHAPFASEVKVTKFPPPPVKPDLSTFEEEEDDAYQPVFQEQFKPAASERQSQSIQLPDVFRAQVEQAGLLEPEIVIIEEESPEIVGGTQEVRSLPASRPIVSITEDLSGGGIGDVLDGGFVQAAQGTFLRRRR